MGGGGGGKLIQVAKPRQSRKTSVKNLGCLSEGKKGGGATVDQLKMLAATCGATDYEEKRTQRVVGAKDRGRKHNVAVLGNWKIEGVSKDSTTKRGG